ncbi:MAG: hypothetical protein ACRDRJ_37625 [Streptosporangiaceae bacterium]
MTARLDLDVLEGRDARHLLAAYGLDDGRVPDIVDWAAGSPLALALAADAALADADWNAATGPDRPDIIKSLLHRLVETELAGLRPGWPCSATCGTRSTASWACGPGAVPRARRGPGDRPRGAQELPGAE